MPPVKQFEDLECWKKARILTREVYKASASGHFSRDFGLRDQIRRAAVSIMSNIAEGFERGGNKEFLQFLATARGSAAEVRSQLYVALDAGHLDQAFFDTLHAKADEIGRMVTGLMRYLQDSNHKGPKFERPENPSTSEPH